MAEPRAIAERRAGRPLSPIVETQRPNRPVRLCRHGAQAGPGRGKAGRQATMDTGERPIVYGAPYSVYVRAVRLTLEEKRVAYDLVPVDVFAPGGPPVEHLTR